MAAGLFRSPRQGIIRKTFERPPADAVAAFAHCYTGFIIDRTGKQGIPIAKTVLVELAEERVEKTGLTAWRPWPVEGVLRERGYRFED